MGSQGAGRSRQCRGCSCPAYITELYCAAFVSIVLYQATFPAGRLQYVCIGVVFFLYYFVFPYYHGPGQLLQYALENIPFGGGRTACFNSQWLPEVLCFAVSSGVGAGGGFYMAYHKKEGGNLSLVEGGGGFDCCCGSCFLPWPALWGILKAKRGKITGIAPSPGVCTGGSASPRTVFHYGTGRPNIKTEADLANSNPGVEHIYRAGVAYWQGFLLRQLFFALQQILRIDGGVSPGNAGSSFGPQLLAGRFIKRGHC